MIFPPRPTVSAQAAATDERLPVGRIDWIERGCDAHACRTGGRLERRPA